MPITPEQLAEWRAACEAASSDLDLARLAQHVPTLLDEVERLRATEKRRRRERMRLRAEWRVARMACAYAKHDLATAREEADYWLATIGEAGVEFEDSRVSYVSIQISREDWIKANNAYMAARAANEEKP